MVSQKTFREFVEICETLELDEIAAVPAGKKLRYKGGEPLPPEDRRSLQTISNMNRGIYPKPNQQGSEPESKTQPSAAKRRGRRIQFDDRSNASSQGRRGRGGSRFREEVENFDEGIGTSIINSPLFANAPVASRRGEIRRKYLLQKTLGYANKAKEKPVSGRAADPNAPRRGRRVRNSGDQNA